MQTHNARCGEFEAQVVAARNGLALDMVAESSGEYKSLTSEVDQSQLATTRASGEVHRLEKEIAYLEQEIVEHRRPATELNEDLKKYLGHGELQLAVKETGYEITRNGDPAQSLSEGETTAIALLYFLKSLDDRRFDSAKGVVVLDDPVLTLMRFSSPSASFANAHKTQRNCLFSHIILPSSGTSRTGCTICLDKGARK